MDWLMLLFAAMAFGGRDGRPDTPDTSGGSAGEDEPEDQAGQAELRQLLQRAGLSEDWQTFFLATAGGESGWNNLVGLGPNDHPGRPPFFKPSKASEKLQRGEARAAKRAYDNNAKLFRDCPFPADRYTFGSGGYFGLLPAFGLYAFRGTPLICTDPWDVSDPAVSVAMAVDFARRTMLNRNPTSWLALRTGWGNPAKTNDKTRQQKVMDKPRGFGFQLDRLGVPRSFAEGKPTPLPKRNPVELLARLR